MPAKAGTKSAFGDSSSKDPKKGKVQQKEDGGEFLNIAAMQHNARTFAHARIFSGVMAGCVAGLLKYEGLAGVLVFLVITLVHSTMIFVKMKFNVSRHFPHARDVFVSQFTHGLMSFILFWTLAYDMVHIF
eukprot:CAMPEP_0172715504 /NCGR_PEP_ID=MMETSP1074-20121228/67586_1 /TAXON_ID=2916 /ORGANISM="Ceratium fusus, Strain PA161109" /LENGTH=130 /DNA_ID=CAMNT_0013540089 /DNA_START=79 /DNA_END=471 /DNA_ORIENTATION=-